MPRVFHAVDARVHRAHANVAQAVAGQCSLAVVLRGVVPPLGRDVGLTRDLRSVPRGGLGLGVRALFVATRDIIIGHELDRRIRRLPGRISDNLMRIGRAILRRLWRARRPQRLWMGVGRTG